MNKRTYQIGSSTLTLEFEDITTSRADVLVSSDDSYLTMGGGVSAAIRRAAGEAILLEVAKSVPAKLGDVIVTGAGSLPAKHVFHAVTIGDGTISSRDVIAGATRRSLSLLRALGLSSIAFPSIGAGVARYPYEEVAAIMAEVIVETLRNASEKLSVTIYLFDRYRRMQQIDYVQFFEEFAARTRNLDPASIRHPSTPPAPVSVPLAPIPDSASAAVRAKKLSELSDLERERQALETLLSQYGKVVPGRQAGELEARLKDIQDKRIALLTAVNPQPPSSVSVFISYSHADEDLRLRLDKHLSVLERSGLVGSWHDRKIGVGTDWEGAINSHLDSARVILLLVSADFLYSPYCYDVEVKRALERHERREALVVPIILRPVALQGTPFSKLQALPKDAKPVTTWPDADSAFVNVIEGLRVAIQDLARAP
ncbi:MAG: macro domain-containing protein [Reyranellaceae bacterium]